MSKPGKSRSALLPIEPTIHRRLAVNVEFEFWINTIWPVRLGQESERELRRTLMTPVRLRRIMKNSLVGRALSRREHDERMGVIPEIYDNKKEHILKFVGEFY